MRLLLPLPLGVWLWMAHPPPHPPVPAAGRLARDVLRDDPLPPLPHHPFRADRETFRRTLVRLPDVRGTWMRTALEGLSHWRFANTF